VIEKRAGRRPALPIASVYNQTTREGQTTRGDSDKYRDPRPSVIRKELAEGQLYQLQEFTIRQQEKARPQEEPQTSTQTNRRVRQTRISQLPFDGVGLQSLMCLGQAWVVGSGPWFLVLWRPPKFHNFPYNFLLTKLNLGALCVQAWILRSGPGISLSRRLQKLTSFLLTSF